MTLFAVVMAGALPDASTSAGRGSPSGSSRTRRRCGSGRNFKSALPWDVFAISTYVTVSLLFWYLGLIPDLATLRDAREDRAAAHRLRDLRARLARLGAALAALPDRLPAPRRPLDAARALGPHDRVVRLRDRRSCPGWHTTIFPPYFVAGAIFCGFAMVITLMIPARAASGSSTSSPSVTSTTWRR